VTDDYTTALREAIAEAEKLVANPPFEASEQDLAEGYDYLAGSIRSSLQMAFDYDLEHPILINPRRRRSHKYDLADYGLTDGAIERDFAAYITRFGDRF